MEATIPTITYFGRGIAKACGAPTKEGKPCPNSAVRYKEHCWRHEPSWDGKRRQAVRRTRAKATKWREPSARMGGRWVSKIEEYVRSLGYIHTKGRFKGQTNIYQLARESGIAYGMLHDLIKGNLEHRMGMVTLGKLCGFLECGPSDLIEWESYPEPPKAPREQLDDDYITPEAYRARAGSSLQAGSSAGGPSAGRGL